MTKSLLALINGAVAGTVTCGANIRLSFNYAESWLSNPNAIALSLSLPLAARQHGHIPVNAFLWGLLPDNEQTLDRWAKQFQVSARNPFSLLANVGEDCPGAVQFVTPQRLAELNQPSSSKIAWLTPKQVGARLKALHSDPSLWRRPSDTGLFSLPGAQPKIALLKQGRRWGIPSGRIPTTHILKPPIAGFDGHAENEHYCLNLARRLGLPSCASQVQRFDGEPAIVVTRFDRYHTSDLAAQAAAESAFYAVADLDPQKKNQFPSKTSIVRSADAAARSSAMAALAKTMPILRLHQEDLCQALGLLPTAKYQNQQGVTPEQIIALLRANSSAPQEDVLTFVSALTYNWIIGGTDAHAKNYALLHGGAGRVRLAPLYDIASVLPYPDIDAKRAKLAMKIGGEHQLDMIGPRQWRKFAEANRLNPSETLSDIQRMITDIPGAVDEELAACREEGLNHPVLDRLALQLKRRANALAKLFS